MGCCDTKSKRRENVNRVEFSERLDSVFVKYNKDGSGSLSRQEAAQLIKDGLAGRDNMLTDEEIEKVIDLLGTDHKGKIYKEDIMELYRRMPQ